MSRKDRLLNIPDFLNDHSFVTVDTLSRHFFISPPTVYRDLRELEEQMLIIRGNGGAMRISADRTSMPLDIRRTIHAKAKAAIAHRAMELVRPHTFLFLDASSTTGYLIDCFSPSLDLTVLTNGVSAAVQLTQRGIRTYYTGGRFFGSSTAAGGKISYDSLDRFHIDMLFFSCYGVEPKGAIVDPSEEETLLRRHLLRRPITSVFLCDGSKFGKGSIFRVASLDQVDYMVTDSPLPPAYPLPRRGILVASQDGT